MFSRILALTALTVGTASAKVTPEMKQNLANMQKDGITADSSFGRHLISKSRRVEEDQANDISFVSGYSIKFIGCHHVTQWASEQEIEEQDDNDDAEQEDVSLNAANGRVRSKGLVRFRLCPSDSCFDHFGMGCSSNYGEYVVDMHQFLEVYIAWQVEEAAAKCATYRNTCYTECYSSTSANCWSSCYGRNGVEASLCASSNGGDDNNNYQQTTYGQEFALEDYLQCAAYQITNTDGEELASYLGPYCANQGGDVRLGFFQDQFCAIPSTYQASYFEKMTGVEVPYTQKSIVGTGCMSCEAQADDQNQNQYNQDYYNYDADGNKNYYAATEVNDLCGTMYMQSGKCESEFNVDDVPYPEEGACTYIESVKQLGTDGIIRADQKISSRPASIAIGIFTASAVLIGGYVYYLKSKIARSRVNLAGATTSLA